MSPRTPRRRTSIPKRPYIIDLTGEDTSTHHRAVNEMRRPNSTTHVPTVIDLTREDTSTHGRAVNAPRRPNSTTRISTAIDRTGGNTTTVANAGNFLCSSNPLRKGPVIIRLTEDDTYDTDDSGDEELPCLHTLLRQDRIRRARLASNHRLSAEPYLLALPVELRLMIFRYLIEMGEGKVKNIGGHGWLMVSKQLYLEATSVLYSGAWLTARVQERYSSASFSIQGVSYDSLCPRHYLATSVEIDIRLPCTAASLHECTEAIQQLRRLRNLELRFRYDGEAERREVYLAVALSALENRYSSMRHARCINIWVEWNDILVEEFAAMERAARVLRE